MADENNKKTFGSSLLSNAVDTGRFVLGGFIDDYFNQKSEERSDARNRNLIRDTPKLQMEGLRSVGLNPYHLSDASMPGMSAQSDTDTSLIGTPFLEQMLSIRSTDADVNLKNEEAETQKSLQSYYDSENQLNAARTGLTYLQQNTERALADKIITERESLIIDNNFYKAIFQDNVDAFVANAKIIKNNAERSDWEQPYIQQQLFMGMLAQVQDIQMTAQEIANAGQQYFNIIADTNYKNSLSARAHAEIKKMEFDQQLELANYFAQFVLQNNEFVNDEKLLKMSQEFNAAQNKKDRVKGYIDIAVGSVSTLVGGLLVASGAGAPVGAILTSLGLTKLGKAFSPPERPRIGYK